MLATTKPEESVFLPALDLLDIKEVNAMSGVRQAGNVPLPPPILDLRRNVPKHKATLAYCYWLRGDILRWVQNLKRRGLIRV